MDGDASVYGDASMYGDRVTWRLEIKGPGGRWRHAALVGDRVREVSRHAGQEAAAASVAAHRATDEETVRWSEPVARRR